MPDEYALAFHPVTAWSGAAGGEPLGLSLASSPRETCCDRLVDRSADPGRGDPAESTNKLAA
jgi:hypothetical protein